MKTINKLKRFQIDESFDFINLIETKANEGKVKIQKLRQELMADGFNVHIVDKVVQKYVFNSEPKEVKKTFTEIIKELYEQGEFSVGTAVTKLILYILIAFFAGVVHGIVETLSFKLTKNHKASFISGYVVAMVFTYLCKLKITFNLVDSGDSEELFVVNLIENTGLTVIEAITNPLKAVGNFVIRSTYDLIPIILDKYRIDNEIANDFKEAYTRVFKYVLVFMTFLKSGKAYIQRQGFKRGSVSGLEFEKHLRDTLSVDVFKEFGLPKHKNWDFQQKPRKQKPTKTADIMDADWRDPRKPILSLSQKLG